MIGSGPAGVACARALVARGVRPIVLDGGRRLEPEREAAIGRVPVDELRRSFPVDLDELPLKPVHGSTFAYAPEAIEADGFGAVPSLAVGGLGAVWGAAMLPYSERDHDGWPFGPDELAPHYRAVFDFVPLAGEEDALAAIFPLYGDARPLRATRQVSSMLADLRRVRSTGVVGGRARLAVHVDRCDYLGMCLLGCPRSAIWSSEEALRALVADGGVDHRPGTIVDRVEERAGRPRVHLRGGGTLDADVVLVAAGALATTRIALASLETYELEVTLLDSAYSTFPLLRWRGAPREEQGNTLAQAFLEIDDGVTSTRPVHVQLYGFNDLMLQAAAARTRLPEPVVDSLFAPLLRRLVFAQAYLHSDVSPGARAMLRRDGVLHVRGDGDARPAAARVLRTLRSLRRQLRMDPVGPLQRVWPPGMGFHVGGSLPMRSRPSGLETDLLGRIPGFAHVHLADAAAFPTVPATTITLAAMANAHRIAAASLEA